MNKLVKGILGIKREFSVARTQQQNGLAKRKNRLLIEAARTMLADSKLPTTFWAEAVNTACYVQNRVLVIKPHNKTPLELFLGRKPALNFMRPFGCPVTILNTIYHLGKFNGKGDEGFFVGYSTNSKAFTVFNGRTRIVEENLHVKFSKDTPNIAGSGPNWLFDIDALTNSMNYKPVVVGNQSNGNASTKACDNFKGFSPDADSNQPGREEKECDDEDLGNEDNKVPSTEEPKRIVLLINNIVYGCDDDPNIPKLEEIVYSDDDEDVGAEAYINNLDTYIPISPIPTTRILRIHTRGRLIMMRVFAHVARIEAIGLFLAYALFKKFVVYQMDVNSAFLYGKIEDEVYVCQPPRFKDPDFPDRVYKVEKALYGLHQDPRAWYETLSTYLLDNGFQRGKINKTLFIKRDKGDILLVQVYVDDIIFGFTKKSLCTEFEKMMHKKSLCFLYPLHHQGYLESPGQ
ncbi:retrovirus-related pol polyprotein from transposon TNT 1-94 [Tanacetum coccineum]